MLDVILAQAAAPTNINVLDWSQFALQGGFAGIVCWMLLHYTRVVIPKMHEDHRIEREATLLKYDLGLQRVVEHNDASLQRVLDHCELTRKEDRETFAQERVREDVRWQTTTAAASTAALAAIAAAAQRGMELGRQERGPDK